MHQPSLLPREDHPLYREYFVESSRSVCPSESSYLAFAPSTTVASWSIENDGAKEVPSQPLVTLTDAASPLAVPKMVSPEGVEGVDCGVLGELNEFLDSLGLFVDHYGAVGDELTYYAGEASTVHDRSEPVLTLQDAHRFLLHSPDLDEDPLTVIGPLSALESLDPELGSEEERLMSSSAERLEPNTESLKPNVKSNPSLLDKLKDLCKSSSSNATSTSRHSQGRSASLLPGSPKASTPASPFANNCQSSPGAASTEVPSISNSAATAEPGSSLALSPSEAVFGSASDTWRWEAVLENCSDHAELLKSSQCVLRERDFECGSESCKEGVSGGGRNDEMRGEGGTDAEEQEVNDPEGRLRQQRLERNRQSALQSRQRRKQYVQELEQRCRALEAQMTNMRQIVAMTALENGALRDEVVRLQVAMHQMQQHQQKQLKHSDGVPGDVAEDNSNIISRSLNPSQSMLKPPCRTPLPPTGDGQHGFQGSEVLVCDEVAGTEGTTGAEDNRLQQQQKQQQQQPSLGAELVGAEPAALDSDSLPTESLLHPPKSTPQELGHCCCNSSSCSTISLSLLHLFFLLVAFWKAAPAAVLLVAISLSLCLHRWELLPGLYLACPWSPSRSLCRQHQLTRRGQSCVEATGRRVLALTLAWPLANTASVSLSMMYRTHLPPAAVT